MSHVTLREADTADQQISDIKALRAACDRIGLEFREGQNTFRTWASDHGRLVGDWPLPAGFKNIQELNAATKHAIGIPGKKGMTGSEGYEIGLIESKKFPGTFSMAYDFYGGRLDSLATTDEARKRRDKDSSKDRGLDKLTMYYQAEAARNKAKGLGYQYKEKIAADGSIDVEIDMTLKLGY